MTSNYSYFPLSSHVLLARKGKSTVFTPARCFAHLNSGLTFPLGREQETEIRWKCSFFDARNGIPRRPRFPEKGSIRHAGVMSDSYCSSRSSRRALKKRGPFNELGFKFGFRAIRSRNVPLFPRRRRRSSSHAFQCGGISRFTKASECQISPTTEYHAGLCVIFREESAFTRARRSRPKNSEM